MFGQVTGNGLGEFTQWANISAVACLIIVLILIVVRVVPLTITTVGVWLKEERDHRQQLVINLQKEYLDSSKETRQAFTDALNEERKIVREGFQAVTQLSHEMHGLTEAIKSETSSHKP